MHTKKFSRIPFSRVIKSPGKRQMLTKIEKYGKNSVLFMAND